MIFISKQNLSEFNKCEEIQRKIDEKIRSISKAMKAEYKKREKVKPSPIIKSLSHEVEKLRKALGIELERIMSKHGITEETLLLLENAKPKSCLFPIKRQDISETPSTYFLDDIIPIALEKLKSLVDPNWLKLESQKKYRFTKEYL